MNPLQFRSEALFRIENDLRALRGDLTVMLAAQRAIIRALLLDNLEDSKDLAASEAEIARVLAIPGR